jgi:hypothetical protein
MEVQMFDYFNYANMNERYNERLQKAEHERWLLRWKAAHREQPKLSGETARVLQLIYSALQLSGIRPF